MRLYFDFGNFTGSLDLGDVTSKYTEDELITRINADINKFMDEAGIRGMIEIMCDDISKVKCITEAEYGELIIENDDY